MFALGKRGLGAMGAVSLLGWALAGSPGNVQAQVVLPAYFNPDDAEPPMVFMQQAPPPVDNYADKTTYAYGPLTESIAQNITAQNNSTWTDGHMWASVWANRARVPPRYQLISPNPIYPAIRNGHGTPYGTEFTTYARANAATKAQILFIMGAPPSVWQAPLTAAGISAVPWSTIAADPGAWFTHISQDGSTWVMLDKMIIPTTVSTSAYGVRLDYEVQDDRTPPDAYPFLDDLGATIRSYGLKAYLYTNPWDSGSTQENGFSFSTMDDIKANFDYISLLVWGGQNQCIMSTSYPYSVNFLKGASGKLNFNQILLTVDLLHCSHSEAIQMYNQRAIDHFAGYVIWGDFAEQGGSTLTGSNLVIWGLLHGN